VRLLGVQSVIYLNGVDNERETNWFLLLPTWTAHSYLPTRLFPERQMGKGAQVQEDEERTSEIGSVARPGSILRPKKKTGAVTSGFFHFSLAFGPMADLTLDHSFKRHCPVRDCCCTDVTTTQQGKAYEHTLPLYF